METAKKYKSLKSTIGQRPKKCPTMRFDIALLRYYKHTNMNLSMSYNVLFRTKKSTLRSSEAWVHAIDVRAHAKLLNVIKLSSDAICRKPNHFRIL